MPLSTRLRWLGREDIQKFHQDGVDKKTRNGESSRPKDPSTEIPPSASKPKMPTESYARRRGSDKKWRRTWLPSSGGTGMRLNTAKYDVDLHQLVKKYHQRNEQSKRLPELLRPIISGHPIQSSRPVSELNAIIAITATAPRDHNEVADWTYDGDVLMSSHTGFLKL